MTSKKNCVALTPSEREQVEVVARSYKHSVLERKRAHILLLADTNQPDGGQSDLTIAQQVAVSEMTVQNARRRFAHGGMKASLYRKEQSRRKARRLEGAAEAFLVATVCSAPPDGQARWSLHLLADTVVGSVSCFL